MIGLILVLAAAGIIPLQPGQLRASPDVLFATGLLFVMVGALALAQSQQARRPNLFRMMQALAVSAGALLVALVTFRSHDERLAIGPFVFKGPAVDRFGKIVLGLDALLMAAAAAWCWRRFWRHLAGEAGSTRGPDRAA